jgi:prepilin-type N-terminal cleavage/methylation domain-containing protein
MFIAPGNVRRRGFTLLEITLAVAILGMMGLAIYRFVQSNLISLRVSSEQNAVDARYSGLLNLLTTQWQTLPQGQGAMTGEPFKFNDRPRDEITWVCGAGPGLLTRYAEGDFRVTMRLRPVEKSADRFELGVVRRASNDTDPAPEHDSWVSLMPDVASIQIRYFDPRLNAWVDKWTDTSVLPRLVRLVIGNGTGVPWEAIIALGRTPL